MGRASGAHAVTSPPEMGTLSGSQTQLYAGLWKMGTPLCLWEPRLGKSP